MGGAREEVQMRCVGWEREWSQSGRRCVTGGGGGGWGPQWEGGSSGERVREREWVGRRGEVRVRVRCVCGACA